MTTGTLIAADAGHATDGAGGSWPFAAMPLDIINRAMRSFAPRTQSANDVGALTAYVLDINGMVRNNFFADRNALPKVDRLISGQFK